MTRHLFYSSKQSLESQAPAPAAGAAAGRAGPGVQAHGDARGARGRGGARPGGRRRAGCAHAPALRHSRAARAPWWVSLCGWCLLLSCLAHSWKSYAGWSFHLCVLTLSGWPVCCLEHKAFLEALQMFALVFPASTLIHAPRPKFPRVVAVNAVLCQALLVTLDPETPSPQVCALRASPPGAWWTARPRRAWHWRWRASSRCRLPSCSAPPPSTRRALAACPACRLSCTPRPARPVLHALPCMPVLRASISACPVLPALSCLPCASLRTRSAPCMHASGLYNGTPGTRFKAFACTSGHASKLALSSLGIALGRAYLLAKLAKASPGACFACRSLCRRPLAQGSPQWPVASRRQPAQLAARTSRTLLSRGRCVTATRTRTCACMRPG